MLPMLPMRERGGDPAAAGIIPSMSERGLPAGESSAPACPFVAFEDERDERSSRPDHRHRCYAELRPAPRALAHQEAFCLSSAFPACPTFQDWARREAARERQVRAPELDEAAPDPFGSRPTTRRPWAAPPPWLGDDGNGSDADGNGADEDALPARGRPAGATAAREANVPGFLDRPGGRTVEKRDRIAPRPPEAPDGGRSPGRGLADVDPERPWLAGWTADAGHVEDPEPDRPGRAGALEQASEPGAEVEDDSPWGRGEAGRTPRALESKSLVEGIAGGIGGLVNRDRRPKVGDARRSASPAVGTPTTRASAQARLVPPPRDPAAPPWERPRRMEAYPTLKTRIGLPSMSPVALGFGALLVAALALLVIPLLLFHSGGDNSGTSGVPTPSPSVTASASTAPTATPAPSSDTYTVKPGDTLSTIAKRLGVTLDELLAANPQIKDPNKIGLGDQINIPSKTPTTVTDASPGQSASASP